MKKILITGGSGFIGTNLIKSLINRKDISLLNIDLAKSPISDFDSITVKCDVRDYEKTREVITKFNPDYIIHLAARTDLDGMGIDDYSSNTDGVRNVIDIAKALSHLKRIIITSSMLVCKVGHQPISNDDYCPTTFYGESKVLTEKITKEANLSCSWFFIRPTSIWGPGFKVPYRNFFDMIMKHRYFHIGKKSCTKTYGYVGNSIYQIKELLFSDAPIPNGEVFYIGDPALNIESWANNIAKELGITIHRAPYWLIKIAAKIGDFLALLGLHFPMTSFRLKNMTTNNIIDLSKTERIVSDRPYDEKAAIHKTIEWLCLNK